tara:strand:- start:1032 stop:1862 length:831 start_codon:yes stop_codon:yes gene_type:complete
MRNNQRRLGQPKSPQPSSPAASAANLAFAVPTEFVELPSQGKFYPEDHLLHQQETVEIRFMTAKDEDILSSESLLKKGLAIDRLLESLLVDDIDPTSLLVSDRNAILVAARISGYGEEYDVTFTCKGCFLPVDTVYDLKSATLETNCFNSVFLKRNNVVYNNNTQTFDVELPSSGVTVGLQLLNGADERFLANDDKEKAVTSMLNTFIAKVDDKTDPGYINDFVEALPVKDSRYLRNLYPKLIPRLRLIEHFKCPECYKREEVEVPLSAGFFWPKQ